MNAPPVAYLPPWGSTKHADVIAPGIIRFVSNDLGYGGYCLDQTRWLEVLAVIPDAAPELGPGVLRETCDWAYAALTWPKLFGGHALANVCRYKEYFKSVKDRLPPGYWSTKQGRQAMELATQWLADHQGHYESVSDWTEAGGIFMRVNDGHRINVKDIKYYARLLMNPIEAEEALQRGTAIVIRSK